MSGALEIKFLRARPEVLRDGAPVRLQPQDWNLLALLAVRPGKPFTSDQLQTELYQGRLLDHDGPIRTAMSKLRSKLGTEFLPRGTYLLDGAWVDATEFVNLTQGLRSGDRPAEVIEVLGKANAVWLPTDPAFHGDHWPFLVEEYRSELELLRQRVDVMLAEALTATGDHQGASELLWPGFFESAVPEPQARVLARSLALRGDRTAALDVLVRHEEALDEFLGVGPSAAVIRLRTDIEFGDGEFAPAESVPASVDLAHVELLLSLGRSMRLLGDPDHLDKLLEAARLAMAGGWPDPIGRAVTELCSHSGTSIAGGSHEETLHLLHQAVNLESMSPEIRAEMLAASSALLTSSESWGLGQANFTEALGVIASSDDRVLRTRVLMHTHLGMSGPHQRVEREGAIRSLTDLASTDDERWEAAYLRFWQAAIHGRVDDAGQELELMETLTPQAVQRRVSPLHTRAAFELLRGDPDAAESQSERAYALAQRVFPGSWARHHHVNLLLGIRIAQGRAGELATRIDDEVKKLGDQPNWRTARTFLYAESARVDDDAERRAEASTMLDDFQSTSYGTLWRDLSWTGALWLLGKAALVLDHRGAAAEIAWQLRDHDDELGWIGHCTVGSIAELRRELLGLIDA